jgi:CheY-like chemotaxis protein
LINLLNNAVKFTPEGGRITLEVSPVPLVHQAEPAGEPAVVQNYLQIAVIDTGIGIAPENISRLFKPFMQIDGALNRKYEGTGLGLALVKQMVELHGGQVGLTSEVGVGSRFTIDLPCSTCHLPAVPSPTMQTEDSPEPSRSFVILLADDSKANILSMASYLEAKGYQWLAAETGTEAIALIGTERSVLTPNWPRFQLLPSQP